MKRNVVKKPSMGWSAGGQVLPGKKPSPAAVLRYLKAIEKRDGVKVPRLRE